MLASLTSGLHREDAALGGVVTAAMTAWLSAARAACCYSMRHTFACDCLRAGHERCLLHMHACNPTGMMPHHVLDEDIGVELGNRRRRHEAR